MLSSICTYIIILLVILVYSVGVPQVYSKKVKYLSCLILYLKNIILQKKKVGASTEQAYVASVSTQKQQSVQGKNTHCCQYTLEGI
jgi:hypothetical protein